MAEAVQQVLDESTSKKGRKSYSREKLKVVKYYHDNGKNLYKTCKRFSMNSKSVMRWVKDEEKIRGSNKGSKQVNYDRRAQYPEMEAKLFMEYKAAEEGIKGEGMVVSPACEANSHQTGARHQLPIFQWMVFGLQEMPPNKHEASYQHLPERARG